MSSKPEKWPGAPAISRKFIPPLWLLLTLGLQAVASHLWPIATWLAKPWGYAGGGLIAMGVAMAVWASRLFRRVETGVVPFSASTSLVVGGPYRFTRNPMYVGMLVGLVGAALLFGTVSPLLLVVAFFVLIDRLFVQYEERMLESVHGESYLELKRRVRRWL